MCYHGDHVAPENNMLPVIFLCVYSYSVQAMAFILYLSSFLETLALCHNLAN